MPVAGSGQRPRPRRGCGSHATVALLLCGLGAATEAAVPAESSGLPRGVGPRDAERYAAALSGAGGGFRCLDGSSEGLSAAAVNDDFCDCADGSDEPGTAACAGQELLQGQSEAFFFCTNAGAQQRYIYRSRVNDGICDCCDGSDEWRTGACSDTCFEDGRAFREAEALRLRSWEKGTELQRRLADESAKSLQSWRSQLQELQAALPGLERESKVSKKKLEEAKALLPPEPEAPSTGPPAPSSKEATPEDDAVRLTELEAMLDPQLKGERRALAALGGECKVRTVDKFSYEVCFFRAAFQTFGKDGDEGSPVSLGRWAGWDFSVDPPQALFEDGSECPGGQKRKLTVTFKCSSKAKLKTVTEPEACVYNAEVLHPGACDDSRAPEEGSEEGKFDKWAKVLSTQKELLESVDRELDSWRSEKAELERKLAATKGAEASSSAATESKPDPSFGAGEGGEQPKISEYAKWMEGGADDASAGADPTGTTTTTTGVPATQASSSPPEPEVPEAESPERKAHREAEARWSEASAAAREAKLRAWGLEARLHPGLTGGLLALASLADECLEKTVDKFTYKVCFFRYVHQDTDSEKGVSLGRWMGWDFDSASPRARFDRGAACGNGVRRSLTVSFACGERAAIETVTETKACVYEAEVLHPAACDAGVRPEKKQLPALLPRDEL